MRLVLTCVAVALAGCGTSFDAGELGLPVDTLNAAFVQTKTYSPDTDGDGDGCDALDLLP